MLFETKSEVDIHEMSPLALAFVGDAVLELLVRARLVGTTRLQPNRLHTVATHYVSAHAQNLELAVIEPMLTDAEAAVLRRGKNASKATVAKHATVQEYRASTGFECPAGLAVTCRARRRPHRRNCSLPCAGRRKAGPGRARP